MSYDAPTASDIKTRFPEFASVADSRIAAVIAEANRQVDDSWLETDYKPAIQFLTAHMLVQEGVLNPEGVAAQATVSGPITSERIGDASVSYASSQSSGMSAAESELNGTSYGRRFLVLRNSNVRGPLIV